MIGLIWKRRVQLPAADRQVYPDLGQLHALHITQIKMTGDFSHVLIFADRLKVCNFKDLLRFSYDEICTRPVLLQKGVPLLWQLTDPAYPKAKGTAGQLTGDIPSGHKLLPLGDDTPTYADLGINKMDAWRWTERVVDSWPRKFYLLS